ncbi:MAG: DUF559 domain-containing protein [Chloroflexi bacterium]|nr:DUF559 domain-containing protein [Chloroflexota bacterium]
MSLSARARPIIQEAARDLRKAPTRSEAMLWAELRNRKLGGRKFRRQHAIGRFVVDFYCVEEHLAIEVDGGVHGTRKTADIERQRILEFEGVRLVRLPARLVEDDMFTALKIISNKFESTPSPAERERDDSPKANRGEG